MSEVSHPLLVVQEHDTALDHLRHERESLPERNVIVDGEKRQGQVEAKRAQVAEEHGVIAADQKRREDEIASLEAKVASENDKLYGGTITSPKEAQAIQEELAALARHQDHLETELLEVMDKREPLDELLAQLDAALGDVESELTQARASLAQAEADIDAKIVVETQARADSVEAVAAVDADLLAKYDDIRRGYGASTVVTFDGKNCVGCPMIMPAMVLDTMKKADAGTVNPCSECGRLVIK